MNASTRKISDARLREFTRGLDDAKNVFVKVGVLRGKAKRGAKGSKGPSNADIGAVHEFGAPEKNIPERSWLRLPVMSRLGDELRKVKTADLKRIFAGLGLKGIMRVVGQAAYNVIADGFRTGGFGRWAPLRPRTIARKGSAEILVETNQLRDSISFEVVEKGSD